MMITCGRNTRVKRLQQLGEEWKQDIEAQFGTPLSSTMTKQKD